MKPFVQIYAAVTRFIRDHLLPIPSPARISEPAKTLLVVDDDPMVRDVETQILRLQGYTVLEAEGAAEALRLAGETAAIHLLITDLVDA